MTRRFCALVGACALAASAMLVGLGLTAEVAYAAQPVTWSAAQARVPYAQYPGHYGAGVTVAVLDTWIDATHPDFGGRVLPSVDCVGGSCQQKPVAPDNCEPHGTHVAGIVASATYGVAPSARILPVRVLSWNNNACTADSGDVARGINYAAAHGARVINISLGTAFQVVGQVTDVANAVEAASAAGILVVAAAGNQQAPVGNSYGADAVIVAATGPSGQLAAYSQRGTGVVLAAPGGDPSGPNCDAERCVVSTWAYHQFAAFAGTSMASPQVAGTAALLWAQNPNRSRADVLHRMTSTARPLASAGSGLLDAAGALGVTIVAAMPAANPPPQYNQVQPPAASAATPPVVTATHQPPVPKLGPNAKKNSHPAAAAPVQAAVGTGTDGARTRIARGPTRTGPVTVAALLAILVGGGWLAARRWQSYSR